MTEQDSPVRLERSGSVLVVTIDRPEARNAIDTAVAVGLVEAVDRLDQDPDLRVGVLTGAGGFFCAGLDLKEFAAGESHVVAEKERDFMSEPPQKPIIAAIEGFAVGGGLEMALACDLIVASRGAKLGLPEVTRGLVPLGGALVRLPRRIPYHAAMKMALTGELISAERADELGLLATLAEPGDALADACRLAEQIVANGPLGVACGKRILTEQWDWSQEEMWERQLRLGVPVFESADAREGAAAFAERRDPVWHGR